MWHAGYNGTILELSKEWNIETIQEKGAMITKTQEGTPRYIRTTKKRQDKWMRHSFN